LKADQPTGTFRSWCTEFDWVRRAELWDDHEDEHRRLVRQAKKEQALDVMTENIVGLTKTLVLIAAGKSPDKMPGDHAQIRAIENALDRLGITAPKQLEITGKDGGAIETHEKGEGEESIDFSKLDNDELREFIRLRRKAKAKADGNGDDK